MIQYLSDSTENTIAFAEKTANLLRPGDFIALCGELGAGKTKFAGGIAKGLAVDSSIPVTSPTYTLLNIYQGRIPLYHFDLYRLKGDDDVIALGFSEYFYGSGVCLVEWSERLQEELPQDRLEIYLRYVNENCRSIKMTATSKRYQLLLESLSGDNE